METEKAKELLQKIIEDKHPDYLATMKETDDLSDNFDSLDAVELAMEIEKATSCHIADEEIEKWKKVSDIIATIEGITPQ